MENGDLTIACTLTPTHLKLGPNEISDYKLEISLNGGGVQAASDGFTFQAPDTGYQPSVIIEEKAADPNHRDAEVQREFYVKTADGHYGVLSVDWAAWQRPPTAFKWRSIINPSGSRNLER